MIASHYIIDTNQFERPSMKVIICKINNFFIVTSIYP